MSHGKALNHVEKDKFLVFHVEKLSNWEIARRLNRSEHLIKNFLKTLPEYDKNVHKPKQKKLRERCRIVRLISNSIKSLSQVKSEVFEEAN